MRVESVYEVCAPDIVAEDFGGEIVVLNLLNGKYFSLLGVSADIWRDLARGHPPQDIIGYARVSRPEFEAAVAGLIGDMVSERLIRPVTEDATDRTRPVEEGSSASSIAACVEVPKIEAFDDMAELILADPIHDVEEDMGWPMRRNPVRSA